MRCHNCGKDLKDGAKYCTSCGAKIEFVDIKINSEIDEFELERIKIEKEQQEQELLKKNEEIKAENETRKKIFLENLDKKIKNVYDVMLKFTLIIFIAVILIFSIYSLYGEMTNNRIIINDDDDISLIVDGNLQKNIKIKYDNKIYYIGNDGHSQLYKMVHIGDNIKAQSENGEYIKNKTARINGYFYHFDINGNAIKNCSFDDSFFKPDGTMLINDWHGDYYYGEDGKMKKNMWIDKYYVGDDGKYLKSSWTPDNCYVNEKGEKVVNNKILFNDHYYYIDDLGQKVVNTWKNNNYYSSNGTMIINSYTPDGYYVDENGNKVINSTHKIGNDIIYFDSNGKPASDGWTNNYYIIANGKILISNWTPDGFYVDENGLKVVSSQKTINDKSGKLATMYFDDFGKTVANKWEGDYYYGEDGNMLKGTTTPDGFEVDENGKYINKINNMTVDKIETFKVSSYCNFGIPQFKSDNPERLKTANLAFMELYDQINSEIESYDSVNDSVKFDSTASIVRQDNHELKVKISGNRRNRDDSTDRNKIIIYFTYDKDNEVCTYEIVES